MQVNYPPSRKTTSFMPNGQTQTPAVNVQPQQPEQPLGAEALPVTNSFTDLAPLEQRESLARGILGEGLDSSPLVGGWGQGLARMGQALVGGILLNKAQEATKTAKQGNRNALMGALEGGDISTLLTSEDPIGQRLGAALMEQQFKRQGGPKLLSSAEKQQFGIDPSKIVQYDPNEGFKILDNDKPMTSSGMISYDRGRTWAPIEGYVDNKKAIHAATTNPKTTASDQSGKLPWERKW